VRGLPKSASWRDPFRQPDNAEAEFGGMVCCAVQDVTAGAAETEMLEAARTFWKSLCSGLAASEMPTPPVEAGEK
jgi:hypothetical protein